MPAELKLAGWTLQDTFEIFVTVAIVVAA